MSDSYQAVYDAVRSRICNGDVGRAVEEVARNAFDMGHTRAIIQQEFVAAAYEMQRPSAIYRPELSADGDQWMALYGENLQLGVAGFGSTPNEAMTAFDQAWWKQKTPAAVRLADTSSATVTNPGTDQ